MENPFPYSYADKRYHTWNYHLKERFHQKIFKVMINAGFTCPNIDGTVKYGGCTFCSTNGSGDFAGNPEDELKVQFNSVKEMMHKKWPEASYIGYFQAFSNTHAPVEVLKRKYEAVLECDPNIVGLSIATRPDCLPDDVVDYLGELNQKVNLWVELGLQTMHDETGKLINRGHDYQTFVEGVEKLRQHNIEVIVHIINGLPGETYEMMLETAKAVGQLDVQGIKIHLLHVIENTPMHKMLNQGRLRLMEKDEYVNLVVDQLEVLPKEMIIHRVTGDAVREELVGPMWSLKKWEVLNAIDDRLKERNTYQGRLYSGPKHEVPTRTLPLRGDV
ncbi:MAG TPA: TIGR01212 family radical SAM protein [Firmicutes bacterium]|nr:TIGR01212 family radical SAM protein [Bacillota bacterium]